VGTAHDLEVRPTQATSSSFGFMDRRQQLSFDSGVVLSDGKTQAPSPVEMASARQASISRYTPSATAASRIDRPVLDYRQFRDTPVGRMPQKVVNLGQVRAKISPGRIPTTIASFGINRSR